MPVGEEVVAWRRERRSALIAARLGLSAEQHLNASQAVERTLTTLLPRFGSDILGCYFPFQREFNILPLAERHIAAGGKVALPVVIRKNNPLEFRLWQPGMAMAHGAYDIAYPAIGDPVEPSTLMISLVGFDEAGYRLGYGGGYYDRTIAGLHRRPRLIGIGFECGRLPTIHPQAHDIALDEIVTEAGLFRREEGRLIPSVQSG